MGNERFPIINSVGKRKELRKIVRIYNIFVIGIVEILVFGVICVVLFAMSPEMESFVEEVEYMIEYKDIENNECDIEDRVREVAGEGVECYYDKEDDEAVENYLVKDRENGFGKFFWYRHSNNNLCYQL